tara:strand:- start:1159 stop:1335 length:177 start_codon:yes stop_codon:yes gene_type:complete
MSKSQLNKEYDSVMLKADIAKGRKEAVGFLHRADSIRKRMSDAEISKIVLHSGNKSHD